MGNYSDEKCVPLIKDLSHLIEELHKVYEEPIINIEYVKALLSSYKSNPKDWKRFSQQDPHRLVILNFNHNVYTQLTDTRTKSILQLVVI